MYRFVLKFNLLLLTITYSFSVAITVYKLISMDDINPAPPVTCIICEGPEMSGRKLARVTAKGYGNLLSYAEVDENDTILDRFKDSRQSEDRDTTWSVHVICSTNMPGSRYS